MFSFHLHKLSGIITSFIIFLYVYSVKDHPKSVKINIGLNCYFQIHIYTITKYEILLGFDIVSLPLKNSSLEKGKKGSVKV